MTLFLVLYGLPVYLIFFRYKLIPLTLFWRIFLWVPPVVALVFLWFALGRYTPQAQDAYVQAPVVQVAPEVGGVVTEVFVTDNQEVKRGTPLFKIDSRPYKYRVDQANAKVIETQQNGAALLASVYAAEESLGKVEASLIVAQKNVAAAEKDVVAAEKILTEVRKQLQVVENSANRLGGLVVTKAASREDYENSLSAVAGKRSQLIDAQNQVSKSQTALEVSLSHVIAAEAGVREARALRGKAEVLVDPVKTFRRAIQTARAELQEIRKSSREKKDPPKLIEEKEAELAKMQAYLKKAENISPFLQDELAAVRQAKESLKDATLNLERTIIKAPADGIVTNLQLAEGAVVKPGVPVISFIDTTRWRLIAAVPENLLELVGPGDEVYFSLRNYPARIRSGKVEHIRRGVIQGQGVAGGNLPDTDPRRTRQTDTPQAGQEFQVIIGLHDDEPEQPLRVGSTGRVTIFAGGGLPVVNQLATFLHATFSFLDYLHPKPSLLVVVLAVALVLGIVFYFRRRSLRAPTAAAPGGKTTSP